MSLNLLGHAVLLCSVCLAGALASGGADTADDDGVLAALAGRREGDQGAGTNGFRSVPQGFIFDCATNFTLMDDLPIGRGFNKEVWRAKLLTGEEFILKRPARESRSARFVKKVAWEMNRAQALGKNNPRVQKIFGVCASRPMQAVEGRLAPLKPTFQQRLPRCFRVRTLRQVLLLLRDMEIRRCVHCDFKPDQLLLDRHGNIRLVDLDAIRKDQLFRGLECSSDGDCGDCLSSLQSNSTDRRCIAGRCLGYDSRSVVQVVGRTVAPLLLHAGRTENATNSSTGVWPRALLRLTAAMTLVQPHLRPTVERALDTLDAVYAELGGDLCTARYQRGIEVEIRRAYWRRIRSLENCRTERTIC